MKRDKMDKDIEDSYRRQCAGTRINIMNIPVLYREVKEAVAAGGDLDGAVLAAIQRYNV